MKNYKILFKMKKVLLLLILLSVFCSPLFAGRGGGGGGFSRRSYSTSSSGSSSSGFLFIHFGDSGFEILLSIVVAVASIIYSQYKKKNEDEDEDDIEMPYPSVIKKKQKPDKVANSLDISWYNPKETPFFYLELNIFFLCKHNDLQENPQKIIKYLKGKNQSNADYPLKEVFDIILQYKKFMNCFTYNIQASKSLNNKNKQDPNPLDPYFKEEVKNFFEYNQQLLVFNFSTESNNSDIILESLDNEQFFWLLERISATNKEHLKNYNFSLNTVKNSNNFLENYKNIQMLKGSLFFNIENSNL